MFYTFNGGNTWSQVQKLLILDGATDDQFGWSIYLFEKVLAISAVYDDSKSGSSCRWITLPNNALILTCNFISQAPFTHFLHRMVEYRGVKNRNWLLLIGWQKTDLDIECPCLQMSSS